MGMALQGRLAPPVSAEGAPQYRRPANPARPSCRRAASRSCLRRFQRPVGSRRMEARRPVLPQEPATPPRPGTAAPGMPSSGAAGRWSTRAAPVTWLGCLGSLLAGICWVTAAGLAVLTALRATGWDRHPAVPALVAFTPWAAMLAPVLLAAAAALRRRALGLVALLLVVVHAVWLAPRFTAEPVPAAPPAAGRLRVMTVNTFGQLDPSPLLLALREERPDLLVLTEAPPEVLNRYEAAGLRSLLPGRVARPSPSAAGTAIYAAAALRLVDAGDLGGETVFENPRATVELAGRTVTIQAAHPFPPNPRAPAVHAWHRDLRLLTDAVAATSGPLITLGDFNASADHASFRTLLKAGRLRDAHDARGRGLVTTWPIHS